MENQIGQDSAAGRDDCASAWASDPAFGGSPSVEADASGWTVVTLWGEQDICTARRSREALHEGAAVGAGRIVIDLSEVQSGDSSLLGVLASAVQLARRRDGTVRVVTSDDHLRLKIEITGLSQTLDVFPTLADAIEGRS